MYTHRVWYNTLRVYKQLTGINGTFLTVKLSRSRFFVSRVHEIVKVLTVKDI